MRSTDIADLLEHCFRKSGCGLCDNLDCWKHYLIHLIHLHEKEREKERILTNVKNGVETVSTDDENRNGHAGREFDSHQLHQAFL